MIARPESSDARLLNALTVDVEDYYHVSVFRDGVARSEWGSFESRVRRNVDRLLEMFREAGVGATFFVLGDAALRAEGLVRDVVAAGFEVGSHGMSHEKLDRLSRDEAKAEMRESKALLEDLSGRPVRGFRAPSFSITKRNPYALDDLAATGYAYDSSVFPIGRPDYGVADAPRDPYVVACEGGRSIVEFPLTVAPLLGRPLPVAGGGYFRLLPYAVTAWGLRRVNAAGRSGMFYLHPWEIDPDQPDLRARTSKLGALRHYTGLRATAGKLRRLLSEFRFESAAETLRAAGFAEAASAATP
jgi:polysaccharide deacetylase family protein (PEP-CTERM system associated)